MKIFIAYIYNYIVTLVRIAVRRYVRVHAIRDIIWYIIYSRVSHIDVNFFPIRWYYEI